MSIYNESTTDYSATSTATSTITAFFEDRSDAESAVERLVSAGIDRGSIRLIPGNESGDTGVVANDDRKGFWASLEGFFFPDEDRAVYSEGLRRGGYLITVTNINETQYESALDILDDEGSIDLDERADLWRSEGWSSTAGAADLDVTDKTTTLTTASSAASVPSHLLDTDTTVATATKSKLHGTDDEVIPVFKEEIQVGKREVNNGCVRVRSYTVSEPIRETISLREENVTVDRRVVDRPIADTDRAFEDRVIEADERHEEALISKNARVVEEIALKKTAEQRDETVSDEIRHTEVEIEDDRSVERTTTERTVLDPKHSI